MKYLEEKIRKNGFDYLLIKKGEKAYIYKQWDDEVDFTVAYEVFKIKIDKEKEVFGDIMPEREVFPGNEDFGKWAWTYPSLEKAEVRFQRLENGEDIQDEEDQILQEDND
jgi:hypothetical protein